MEPNQLTYNPSVFDVGSIDDAMRIILTDEDSTTAQRWATETPYFVDLIVGALKPTEKSLLLDYGCGIGRLAKELIARTGCHVIGVDISPTMRALAVVYVASDRFFTCPPEMLDLLVARGVAFDAALAVWVLQHCLKVQEDVVRIARSLVPHGGLFAVNQRYRAVPTAERGWVNDGVDVNGLLRATFRCEASGPLDARHTTEGLSHSSSWGAFRLP